MKQIDKTAIAIALMLFVTPVVNGQDPGYSPKGADTCLTCHQDEAVLPLFRTPHAVPSNPHSPFGEGQLQCEACHGPGGAHAGRVRRGQERPPVVRFGQDSGTPIAEQNAMCLGCHNDDVGFGWHSGAHPVDEVGCADCHDSHAAREAVQQTATQADVCFACHSMQRVQTQKAFAHPLQNGKMDCTGCHDIHDDAAGSMLARLNVNDTCYQCHAEKRGPFLWEHAPASEDCTLCHAPHGANHPAMLTKRAPLLCQSCHSQAVHPSLPYGPEGLAAGTPSQFLLGQSCMNCHSQVHGSNHPSGSKLMR